MELNEVVIVSVVRTPIGGFQGALSGVAATKLGSVVINAALKRANLKEADVDQVIMGNILSAGLWQAPARPAPPGAALAPRGGSLPGHHACRSRLKTGVVAAPADP